MPSTSIRILSTHVTSHSLTLSSSHPLTSSQRCPSYPAPAPTRAWPVELCQLWLQLPQKYKMKKALALAPSLSSLRKARGNSSFGLQIYIFWLWLEIAFSSDLQSTRQKYQWIENSIGKNIKYTFYLYEYVFNSSITYMNKFVFVTITRLTLTLSPPK